MIKTTDIDKTAEAILKHSDYRGALVSLSQLNDIQTMARLWLMLPEITERLARSSEMSVDLALARDDDLANDRVRLARERVGYARNLLEYASFDCSDTSTLLANLEELQETGTIVEKPTPFEMLFGNADESAVKIIKIAHEVSKK